MRQNVRNYQMESRYQKVQFLSQAAARNARLGNRDGWKSVLKVAPQCIAAVTFRYLSSKNRQVVSI